VSVQDGEQQPVMLQALPYHHAVVAHLQQHAHAVWRHFSSDAYNAEHQEALRLHLLQTTVELTRESYPDLYTVADQVAGALNLGVPVELYQGADEGSLNAALLYQPDTARVVFEGPVQERLKPDQLRALLGHEFAHHRLWSLDEGIHLTAARAIDGIVSMSAVASAEATQRLLALTTEVFADRAGLQVSSLDAAVGCLITTRTGLKTTVSTDFISQSRTLLDAQGTGTRGWTHPEAHVRALALDWFATDGLDADARVRQLLEGPIQLDELDLLRRHELTAAVEQIVGLLLQPTWLRTDAVLGHARQLFDDYAVPELPPALPDLAIWGDSSLDFLAVVLVDFIAVDPTLDDMPLCQAHHLAEQLGLETRLLKQVNHKLKRTRKVIAASLLDRDGRLAAAAEEAST
jgi:hypothetical protein